MKDSQPNPHDAMFALIDRLVANEIDEADRSKLIAWLEHDPSRWRVCGLAFMEAQMWSGSLQQWSEPKPTPVALPAKREPIKARVPSALALACAAAIAFVLGWSASAYRGAANQEMPRVVEQQPAGPIEHEVAKPILASVPVKTSLVSSTTTVQIPVVPNERPTKSAAATNEIPEYVIRQWERRGYRISLETRYLTAQLPDGKPVTVPVESVSLRRITSEIN